MKEESYAEAKKYEKLYEMSLPEGVTRGEVWELVEQLKSTVKFYNDWEQWVNVEERWTKEKVLTCLNVLSSLVSSSSHDMR